MYRDRYSDIMKRFEQWKIYITKDTIKVLDERGINVASTNIDTSSLKSSFNYTVWMNNGIPSICVDPIYKPPYCILLNSMRKIPKELMNTHYPSIIVDDWKMIPHMTEFVK